MAICLVSGVAVMIAATPAVADRAKPVQDCLDAAARYDAAAAQQLCALALQDAGLSKADRAAALLGRGMAADFRHDGKAALADYDQAIQLQPDLSAAYVMRGLLAAAQGDDTSAIADFSTVIKLRPDETTGYRDRAQRYLARHDWSAALTDLDKLVALSPQEADMLFLRGYAHEQLGHQAAAQADYTAARSLDAAIDDRMRGQGFAAAH